MAILPGKRIRDNSIFGTLTGSLTSGSISMASTDLDALTTIAGDHAIITLDPFRQFGDPEIVMVTSHPVGATTAIIQRGMYNTVARSHGIGVQWAHAATVEDFADVVTSSTRPADQFEGQIIYQTDTDSFLYWDGINWRTLGGGAPSTLGYQEIIANQTGITTEVDLVGLSVTVTVPAGRRIRVTARGRWENGTAGNGILISIYQDGSLIQQYAERTQSANTSQDFFTQAVETPSAGTHTYKLTAAQYGVGTCLVGAAAAIPAFILVEDITGTENPFASASVPVGLLAQTQVTTGVSGITTVTTIASVNVSVPAGRVIKVSIQAGPGTSDGTSEGFGTIKEDGGTVERWWRANDTIGGNIGNHHSGFVILSPTAGMHTYTATLERTGGAGTISNEASSGFPTILSVEDITPTPATTNSAPSSTLGYSEVTANQGSITSVVDLSGLSVAVTVAAGRRIRISGHVTVSNTGAGNQTAVSIKEGGTTLYDELIVHAAAGLGESIEPNVVITPTAGTHTYKLTAVAGAGTTTMSASATSPAYILVEDITGVSFPILTLSPGGRHAVSAKRITSNQALVSNAFTPVVFNGVEYNENSAYNAATGVYTVPEDGLYTIKACVRLATATPPFLGILSLFKNGGAFRRGDLNNQAIDNGAQMMIAVENKFVVGDLLTLQVFISAGETSPVIDWINDVGDFNWMTIRRVGPL